MYVCQCTLQFWLTVTHWRLADSERQCSLGLQSECIATVLAILLKPSSEINFVQCVVFASVCTVNGEASDHMHRVLTLEYVLIYEFGDAYLVERKSSMNN